MTNFYDLSVIPGIGEVLGKELECPYCLNIMTPPIRLCKGGHSVCNDCCNKLNSCPTCEKELDQDSRNYQLEHVCDLKLPCSYKLFGCHNKNIVSEMNNHEKKCMYALVLCPLVQENTICGKQILRLNFNRHVINVHKCIYQNNSVWEFPYITTFVRSSKSAVLDFNDNLFLIRLETQLEPTLPTLTLLTHINVWLLDDYLNLAHNYSFEVLFSSKVGFWNKAISCKGICEPMSKENINVKKSNVSFRPDEIFGPQSKKIEEFACKISIHQNNNKQDTTEVESSKRKSTSLDEAGPSKKL